MMMKPKRTSDGQGRKQKRKTTPKARADTNSKCSTNSQASEGVPKGSPPKVRKNDDYLVGNKRVDKLETGIPYVVYYHTNRYTKLAIVKKGRTKVKVCMIDTPITVVSEPISECKWMDRQFDIDVSTSAGRFLYYGKYRGITKGATKFLKECKPDDDRVIKG